MVNDIQASDFVENILIILSKLPTSLRNPIMKNRLLEFLSFDDVDKNEIILNIYLNYTKVNESSLVPLMESWLTILSEMPNDKINIFFYHYLLVLSLRPSLLKNFDLKLLDSFLDILMAMPHEIQIKLRDCAFEMILNTPTPDSLKILIPKKLLM